MSAIARLLEQRSAGQVLIRMNRRGLAVLREAGSAKCRIPNGGREAILINVSGGMAGGDAVEIDAAVEEGAALALTTQAAERVYRTLGPAAHVGVKLRAGTGATLRWMPQETILFDGSSLQRTLLVDLEEGASFLAVEAVIFGRGEMGEVAQRVALSDRWRVRRNGKSIHIEAFRVGPEWPCSPAILGPHRAMATVLVVSAEAERLVEGVRAGLGPDDAASAWNGKMVARLLAADAFQLRRRLIQVLCACIGAAQLPKTWTF